MHAETRSRNAAGLLRFWVKRGYRSRRRKRSPKEHTMSGTTIRMPALGESVVEGTVGKWLVQVGQRITRDQPVVEILTDKADSEVPSPEAGVITKILVNEGDVITVGTALCEVDPAATASANAGPAVAAAPRKGKAVAAAAAQPKPAAPVPVSTNASLPPGNGRPSGSQPPDAPPSSPSVRKLAREQGVDLQQLAGSGEGGRVTHDDVLRAAVPVAPVEPSPRAEAPAPKPAPQAAVGPTGSGAFRVPPYVAKPGDEIVSLSRRRRIIADHMVYSKLTAPHVVTFAECDLHKTDKLRKQNKDKLKSEGVNLTMLSFVAAAVTRALREHRNMNARMLDDAYVLLGEINLGIAVDTEEGLVVPVVKHADELTVRGLARAIDALALKAREGTLTPDDLSGKTFTISNPGRMGNMVGGAIISQPNVGILRIGEIKKRVVVIEHDGEDLMAIHPVMYMALSYDHRLVDGVAANGFLHRVVELLEQADFGL
jgi:2-oxoglutarate dehydrogenase E2 component (dihydrolipoamide succinyltransferase)